MRKSDSCRFELIDYMTISFALINIIYILAARGAIAEPYRLLFGYLGCLAVSLAAVAIGYPESYPMPSSRGMRALRWVQGLLRRCYPLTLLAFFFVAVTKFDTVIFKNDLDPLFAAADRRLFGFVPSSKFIVEYKSFALSEILHGAYFLYFVSIPGIGVWLYVKDKKAMMEYIVVAMLIFYASCLTYAILPVVGGRFDPGVRAITETYRFGPFTRAMAFIYRSSGHSGAAFPSTHAAISLVIAITAFRRAKALAPVFIANAILVYVATVFCGYHYVVDLIAALVFVAILYPVGVGLNANFGAIPADSSVAASDAA